VLKRNERVRAILLKIPNGAGGAWHFQWRQDSSTTAVESSTSSHMYVTTIGACWKEQKLGPILVEEDTKNSWSWKSLYVQ
jgi:hypothetical protein